MWEFLVDLRVTLDFGPVSYIDGPLIVLLGCGMGPTISLNSQFFSNHIQGVFFSLDSVRGLSISYFKEFQAVFVHFA